MRAHESYVHLSLSTFVTVCVLTRALVHLLRFGRPSGGLLCLCVCVCFTVWCGHAARSAICSLSVLHKASLSKQATAGELLFLMGYPWQFNPLFFFHSLSLSLSTCWGCATHSSIFPTSVPPFSSLLSLSSLLSVQRPMGGLNPTMPFSSPLRLTLTKLSAWALVMDVLLYSVCMCLHLCVCLCVTAYVNVFFLSWLSYFGVLLGRIIFIRREICK